MNHLENRFFSCLESRILENGELYARFKLGTFFKGQGLTFANALRRTLLTEIPGLIITSVKIQGIHHEFATIPGLQETVLDLLLNVKNLVFTTSVSDLKTLKNASFKTKAFLKAQGPGVITGADIRLPVNIKCVDPNSYIATLNSLSELNIIFDLDFVVPTLENIFHSSDTVTQEKIFELNKIPTPVLKVNYVINKINSKTESEYLSLEIWTDGSLTPVQILHFAFNKLTKNFYQFAQASKGLFFI